jgi:hypothetical protein
MDKKDLNKLVVKHKVDISDINIEERVNYLDGIQFGKIPFTDIDKLRCNGRHLIATLWILRVMDSTVKRKSKWFYVDPYIVEEYNTPIKDWYRCIKQLCKLDIIRIKLREGHHGRNLYCFADKLPEGY